MSVCCAWKEETLESKQQNILESLTATLYSTEGQVQHAVLTAGKTSKKTKKQVINLRHDHSILCQ